MFLGTITSAPCVGSAPAPQKVSASASSYDSALVFWEKPIGDDYGYKVTVTLVGASPKTYVGTSEFSPAASLNLEGLEPDKTYNIEVQIMCGNDQTTLSQKESTTVTTLKAGKLLRKTKNGLFS